MFSIGSPSIIHEERHFMAEMQWFVNFRCSSVDAFWQLVKMVSKICEWKRSVAAISWAEIGCQTSWYSGFVAVSLQTWRTKGDPLTDSSLRISERRYCSTWTAGNSSGKTVSTSRIANGDSDEDISSLGFSKAATRDLRQKLISFEKIIWIYNSHKR